MYILEFIKCCDCGTEIKKVKHNQKYCLDCYYKKEESKVKIKMMCLAHGKFPSKYIYCPYCSDKLHKSNEN